MRNLIMACLLVFAATQEAYSKPKDFDVIVHNSSSEGVDLGRTGPTVGDIIVTRGEVYLKKTNEQIGTYLARKIIVSVDVLGGSDERDTLAEYSLKDGTITVVGITGNSSGTNLPNRKSPRSIVGGSGAYAGARGVATVSPVDGQPKSFLVEMRFK